MECLSRRAHGWFVAVFASVFATASVGSAQQPESTSEPVARQAYVPADTPTRGHPLDPAIRMARASLRHIQANVADYRALFVKRCRVNGELPGLQYADVKIRNRKLENGNLVVPMGVYVGFLRPASVRGREVIWVENKNDGKLIAHETGIKNLMNVSLDPNSYLAMRGQRHPITEIGIENLAAKVVETAQRDRQRGECDVKFYQGAKVGETKCTMVEVTHPTPRPYFDFHIARVYFSEDQNLPIRYESWSWPTTPGGEPVLEEEYTYLRLKTNVGLTEMDFSTENPDYRFW